MWLEFSSRPYLFKTNEKTSYDFIVLPCGYGRKSKMINPLVFQYRFFFH